MNWIILIVAGLCEVGFTYCLGRAKSVEGLEWWLWIGGFIIFSVVSMSLLAKATQTFPKTLMILLTDNVMSLIACVESVSLSLLYYR